MRLVAGVRPGYVVGDMYTTGPADVLCSRHVTTACSRESIALGADHRLVPAHGDQSAPRVARTFTVEPVVVNGSGRRRPAG